MTENFRRKCGELMLSEYVKILGKLLLPPKKGTLSVGHCLTHTYRNIGFYGNSCKITVRQNLF